MQQGDVLLFQTNDNGNISVTGGIVEMSGGLQTSVYLSLFGGNSDLQVTWWANIDEELPERQYRSELQNALDSIPSTTGNLRRIEDAAKRDLAWLVEQKVAKEVTVAASMPGINQIKLVVDIDGDSSVEFIENWKVKS